VRRVALNCTSIVTVTRRRVKGHRTIDRAKLRRAFAASPLNPCQTVEGVASGIQLPCHSNAQHRE